jgi:hypothetical protein
MGSKKIIPQADKTPVSNRIGRMVFVPRHPPQTKADMTFEFEEDNGRTQMHIALDKERVWHQYQCGDKDLLRLHKALTTYLKKQNIEVTKK